jgi:peptidoglycan hydrolase CwlO-like protein
VLGHLTRPSPCKRSEHANWTEKKNALETSLADIETKITGKRNDINNFKSAIQEVDIVIANFKEDLAKKESGIKTSKADFVKKVGNLASVRSLSLDLIG